MCMRNSHMLFLKACTVCYYKWSQLKELAHNKKLFHICVYCIFCTPQENWKRWSLMPGNKPSSVAPVFQWDHTACYFCIYISSTYYSSSRIQYELSETATVLKMATKWCHYMTLEARRSKGKLIPTVWLASMLSWQHNEERYSMWSHLLLAGSVKYKCVYTNTL